MVYVSSNSTLTASIVGETGGEGWVGDGGGGKEK